MSATQIAKPKRSIKLSTEEQADIESRLQGITRPLQKGLRLGVSREVVEQIELKGSVSERTYRLLFPEKEIT